MKTLTRVLALIIIVSTSVVMPMQLAVAPGKHTVMLLPNTIDAIVRPAPSPGPHTYLPLLLQPTHLPTHLDRPSDLFSADNPFNRPIPDSPPLDPNSDKLIRSLAAAGRENGFNISVRSFSVPVFFANSQTSEDVVRISAEWAPWQSFGPVPIPFYARPDPEDDGHLAVIDRVSGCTYEFWQARRVGQRWVASWGNALRIDSNGFYPNGGGARAGGSSILAGLIWPEELRKGEIDHALVFAYGKTKAGGPVPPATASDGWSSAPDALPEGAHLQLDPTFDVTTLPRWQQPIARALQTYGMYLMDTSGGDISLFAVHPYSLARDPYDTLIPASAWLGDRPSERLWAALDIPLERFRVLRMADQRPNPVEPSRPACGKTEGTWREGVWGVAVEGHTAYLAVGVEGLQVVDVADPQHPRLLSTFAPDEMEAAITVVVQAGRAYVGTAGTGLWIVDVSNPAQPVLLGQFGWDEEHYFGKVAVQGDTLYLADEGIFYIVDISNPRQPRTVGRLEDSDILAEPQDLALVGNLALIADRSLGLTVIDVSYPQHPRWVGVWEDYGEGVVVGANEVYWLNHNPGLQVLMLDNPAVPRAVASVSLPDFPYRATWQDNLLYIADGLGGLQVVDVSEPTTPRRVGQVQVDLGYARDIAVVGSYAYLAMQDGGVAVVDLADPARPQVVAHYPSLVGTGD